jgi:hypothetical protein
MLSVLALVTFLGLVALASTALALLVDGVDQRRLRRVMAQVRVTDAVHRTLGAIVAPTVTRSTGSRWTVTMGLGPRERGAAGRLSEIARETLGQDGRDVEVVFTSRG